MMKNSLSLTLLSLPHELLANILLRLPLKSLLRFRCVSNLCLSLVSDPDFVKSHLEQARSRILLLNSHSPEGRSMVVDASLHDDDASADIKFSFQVCAPLDNLLTVGSCRGFLLFWDKSSDFYLWNPSTGVHKQIPLPPEFPKNFRGGLYGFGFDPSTDDYLVVIASCYTKVITCNTRLQLYSLKANSWETIKNLDLPCMNDFLNPRFGSLLNGAIHWLAVHKDVHRNRPKDIYSNIIFSFDLVKRNYSYISLPKDMLVRFSMFLDVFVHGELLGLWQWNPDGTEVWLMKNYKVVSSWIKSVVVPKVKDDELHTIPICITQNGDIVGKGGNGGLMKHNSQGELLEQREFDEYSARAAIYVESLVSLPNVNNSSSYVSIGKFIDQYSMLSNGEQLEDVSVSLAGQIMQKRSKYSKLIFYDLHGGGYKVQILADASKSDLNEVEFSKFHSNVQCGDVVGITGFPGRSKKGVLSIFPKTFILLSHSENTNLKDVHLVPVMKPQD